MEDGGWGDEDVSYVTLAKAGGRKDLLKHIEYNRPKYLGPTPYETVDWFVHASPTHSQPLPVQQPCDPSSILQWPGSLVEVKKRKRRGQTQRTMKKTLEEYDIKLPKVDPKINMMQLLAMDYQKEWLKEKEEKTLERKRKEREKQALQKKKLEEHTMKARRICGVDKPPEKPRFIMRRFANVKSRVQLPPLQTTANTSIDSRL